MDFYSLILLKSFLNTLYMIKRKFTLLLKSNLETHQNHQCRKSGHIKNTVHYQSAEEKVISIFKKQQLIALIKFLADISFRASICLRRRRNGPIQFIPLSSKPICILLTSPFRSFYEGQEDKRVQVLPLTRDLIKQF